MLNKIMRQSLRDRKSEQLIYEEHLIFIRLATKTAERQPKRRWGPKKKERESQHLSA